MDIITILANKLTIGAGILSLLQHGKEKLNEKELKAVRVQRVQPLEHADEKLDLINRSGGVQCIPTRRE